MGTESSYSSPDLMFHHTGCAQISLPALFLSTPVLVLLTTWILNHLPWRRISKISLGAKAKKSLLPFSVPVLSHVKDMITDPLSFLRFIKTRYGQGIVSLNIFGSMHNIIYDPKLAHSMMRKGSAMIDFDKITWNIVHRVFGVPNTYKSEHLSTFQSVHTLLLQAFGQRAKLEVLTKATIQNTSERLLRLPFVVEEARQNQTNSPGSSIPQEDQAFITADLFSLIRSLVGEISLPVLLGKRFTENHPSLLQEISDIDAGFTWLASGIPAWVPVPRLQKAHRARQSLCDALDDFIFALDNAEAGVYSDTFGFNDLDDISDLVKSLNRTWRDSRIPVSARSPALIPLIWATQINAGNLVFWMAIRILSTPGLVEELRKETAPHIRLHTSSTEAEVQIDHRSLTRSGTLLKSLFLETLRLHHEPWSVRAVKEDFLLPNGPGLATDPRRPYQIRAGEYVSIPHYLIHTDDAYFKDALEFDPYRFERRAADGSLLVKESDVQFFGEGHSRCKGFLYAEIECMSVIAGLFALWDFAPMNGAWSIPKSISTTGVSMPAEDTPAMISRRCLEDLAPSKSSC